MNTFFFEINDKPYEVQASDYRKALNAVIIYAAQTYGLGVKVRTFYVVKKGK